MIIDPGGDRIRTDADPKPWTDRGDAYRARVRDEQTVVRTLRELAQWPADALAPAELLALADSIEVHGVVPGYTCPVCQEVPCDPGCPLEERDG